MQALVAETVTLQIGGLNLIKGQYSAVIYYAELVTKQESFETK